MNNKLTFNDTNKVYTVTHRVNISRNGVPSDVCRIDIDSIDSFRISSLSDDSFSYASWSFSVGYYGDVTYYRYETYANEQDAVDRFKELFISHYKSIENLSSVVRRFVATVSNNHVFDVKLLYCEGEVACAGDFVDLDISNHG